MTFIFFLFSPPQFFCDHYADENQEKTNEDAPENNPQYTTVYVGNLAPEVSISLTYYSHFFACGLFYRIIIMNWNTLNKKVLLAGGPNRLYI